MRETLNEDVTNDSIKDANRITEDVVKKALNMMKQGKSDALFQYNSDCLIKAPEELFPHLVNMFRTFVIHGNVPSFLLWCTLIPLIKDSLGDLASSDNFRAIAISALVLKLFDLVILQLEGNKLCCDDLQFGFQLQCAVGQLPR